MTDPIFQYMPLALWKDMAERFLDPTSFGRLRQVNKALRDTLTEESKEKMVKRCTVITVTDKLTTEIFMNRRYEKWSSGYQRWYKNGKEHRENDLPSAIYPDGTKSWYKNGKQHRENDLPAIIYPDGTQIWCKNGKWHRENDLPAIIRPNGVKEWFLDGEEYREEGRPKITGPRQVIYR